MNVAIDTKKQAAVSWASVAEPQLCVMEALTEQLTRVNALLEGSFNDLSAQFVQMADDFRTFRASTGEEAEVLGQRIEKTLAQSIMSMQFQDRVSQNLVITMDVLRVLAAELEAELSGTRKTAEIDCHAARELYHFLRLGEIRQEYLDALMRRGFIRSPEELGISGAETPRPGDDDIELF